MAISSPYVCSIWCTSVTNGRDLLASLGDPSKFQRVSRLGFVTTGGQPNFARCLSVSWAGILYIHFRRLLLLTEFCQEQYSLYVQVVRSPILSALLHGTRAAAVSQTLWRDTRNRITEVFAEAPPIFGWAAITLGIGPHSSLWSPYVIGRPYIFSSCFFFFFFLLFFPRLISAVGDWMSTILRHMVWS